MPAPTPELSDLRLTTRDRLLEAYARGALTADELTGRLALVRKARNQTELAVLQSDLPASVAPAAAPRRLYRTAEVVQGAPTSRISCVMSEVSRDGAWTPPPHLEVLCVMGSVTLDLRGAVIPAGGLTIDVNCYLGNVEVIVPPGLGVDAHAGSGILGTFAGARGADLPDPGAPVVRLTGSAVLAEVKVEVKLPDERALALLRVDWRSA